MAPPPPPARPQTCRCQRFFFLVLYTNTSQKAFYYGGGGLWPKKEASHTHRHTYTHTHGIPLKPEPRRLGIYIPQELKPITFRPVVCSQRRGGSKVRLLLNAEAMDALYVVVWPGHHVTIAAGYCGQHTTLLLRVVGCHRLRGTHRPHCCRMPTHSRKGRQPSVCVEAVIL